MMSGGGASWSLCSPQQLGIIQTTTTGTGQTSQATPILQNIALPAIINNAQPIELTSNSSQANYIITSQLVNNGSGIGSMRSAELSFLTDTTSMTGTTTTTTAAPTLKLIGQVDLSSGTPKSISLLDAQLQAQPVIQQQQPQFTELKTVGLLNSDAFLSKFL